MSGGALEYISYRVDDAATQITNPSVKEMIFDAAKFLHDLEWYLSGDIGKAEYEEAEMAYFNKYHPYDVRVKPMRCGNCKYWDYNKDSKYGDCCFCEGYMVHRNEDPCKHYRKRED